MTSARLVVFAGGGTAGHVVPALALGEALVGCGHPRSSVGFVGSRRGPEASMVPEAGFDISLLPGRGVERRVSFASAAAALGLLAAVPLALMLLGRRRPAVVVSVGGYAAFPCAVSAVLLRIPLVEVNTDAVPGAVNRLMGRFTRASAVAFEGTPLPRAEVTGTPVGRRVLEARGKTAAEARREMDLPAERKVVVCFGGSLGSHTINEAVVGLARRWLDREDLAIHHVVGRRDWRDLSRRLPAPREGGIFYRAVEYEDRLPVAMAAADLVVCRAGAMSVAEVTVIGVPAVLVPLPGAPGDHQSANAAALERAGAALVLPDRECTPARLSEVVGGALSAPRGLDSMRAASRELGKPDAARRIAGIVARTAAGGVS